MSLVLEKRGIVTYSCRSDSFCGERAADDLLRLLDDGGEMFIALQALGVEFLDIFRPGRTRGKPTALGDNLQAADRSVVAGSARQFADDGLAGQTRLLYGLTR